MRYVVPCRKIVRCKPDKLINYLWRTDKRTDRKRGSVIESTAEQTTVMNNGNGGTTASVFRAPLRRSCLPLASILYSAAICRLPTDGRTTERGREGGPLRDKTPVIQTPLHHHRCLWRCGWFPSVRPAVVGKRYFAWPEPKMTTAKKKTNWN